LNQLKEEYVGYAAKPERTKEEDEKMAEIVRKIEEIERELSSF